MSAIELSSELEFVQKEVIKHPVTKKERWGFYAYGFGSEPFAAVVVAVCAPVMLESLTALIKPCGTSNDSNCSFYLGSARLNPTSFALYVTAISVAIQAIVFVGLSALADHGNNRKRLLLSTGLICSLSCIAYLGVVNRNLYGLAAIITIIANVSFGASYVFYYSYLPTLTQNDEEVLEAKASGKDPHEVTIIAERVGNKVSSLGFAWGYGGAIIALAITAGIALAMGDSEYSLQIAAAVNGAWYLVGIIVTWKWLAPRPGPPLPQGESYLTYSWKCMFQTLCEAPKLSQAFLLLLSWFLLSDGLATVVYVAVLFAKTEMGFTTFEIFLIAFIAPLAAGIGCVFWLQVQRFFKLRTKTMVIMLNTLYMIIPIIGVVSIYAKVLHTKVELYIFGAYHGFLLGALQSFYRTLFAEMLPPGKESQFFGLYQITDKGSSWMGPLIIGAITQKTGQIRYGFYFLLCSFAIPFILNLLIDVHKGVHQAKNYSKKYGGISSDSDAKNEISPFDANLKEN
ncbi:MFS general substrate transporter [Conidiobolus coronatus NRRL 28638]|uniref:Autophagy-related protein n=1 Tax=Conidiobolus coronatus (strain ATCC 28846 / CBS 209.66 / NRRL 28638) TaxID=796925 RepID=A0A137P5H7_CONC2|nr:MFS general substrate transporter [Conidiobolus coronatus NRRL 28638]|eukprot:KXN70268.1 MFS general substrate transporter [Conidiobolus coronatus NRRL 28638]